MSELDELRRKLERCQAAHHRRDTEIGERCDGRCKRSRELQEILLKERREAAAAGLARASKKRAHQQAVERHAEREIERERARHAATCKRLEEEMRRLREERDDALQAARNSDARYFALLRRQREGAAA